MDTILTLLPSASKVGRRAAHGESATAGSRLIIWDTPVFTCSGDMQTAGSTYPDYLFGANRAVSYLVGPAEFTLATSATATPRLARQFEAVRRPIRASLSARARLAAEQSHTRSRPTRRKKASSGRDGRSPAAASGCCSPPHSSARSTHRPSRLAASTDPSGDRTSCGRSPPASDGSCQASCRMRLSNQAAFRSASDSLICGRSGLR